MDLGDPRGGPEMIQQRGIATLGLCTTLLAAVGCGGRRMTEGYYRPLAPLEREIAPCPPDARADKLVLDVSTTPEDTDGDGYPDVIRATAHLFDDRYIPSIREQGEFVFQLFAAGEVGEGEAEPLRRWRVVEEPATAPARSAFGDCYNFDLSLRAGGASTLSIPTADLMCWFEPADGRSPVYAGEISPVRMGRQVMIPQ